MDLEEDHMGKGIVVIFLPVLLCGQSTQAPRLRGDKAHPPKAELRITASGPRTSPFEPPEANDITYVTDASPGLDTGCTFRSGGPLVFEIKVDRVVGELNPDGTLKNAAALVAAGLLSPKATITIPAFDIDFNAVVPPFQPERDRITFNGEDLGFLTGDNNIWKLNTFEIDISKVKFAQRNAGGVPTPGVNTVRVDIDVANADELWCMSMDWGALAFKAISPVILIHGNNSNGGFWDRQGFTTELRRQLIPFDNSINMVTSPVAANGATLAGLIPNIVKSFGVDSVHVVVHSKGGLDTREYLAVHQPANNGTFKILSYTSLSTPHNGSMGADVLVTRAAAAAVADRIEFVNFPNYTRQLAALLGTDAGTPNLTTGFTAGFNAANIPLLPVADTKFNTVAADADTNGNGMIDNVPDEYRDLRTESGALSNIYSVNQGLARFIIDAVYQILRNTTAVAVTYRTEPYLVVFTRTIATITGTPSAQPIPNDTLVTIPSGQGVGGIQGITSRTATFTGAAGRNHSNVANGGVAATVIPWIVDVEKSRGDLR
ncbi:MAG: hypothetical protein IT161_16305 [Bryobacterales bacterium]|nr:hypothetical protein [Bryobacterales bacterium]